jgi:hypothetical protein
MDLKPDFHSKTGGKVVLLIFLQHFSKDFAWFYRSNTRLR